jgi:RNA polymerase sigma factor (sigma-70 family)
VARLRGGDSRAFEAIYDRYERPIRSFCRHMLGQPEDADDAAQHTFLAAYRELVGSDKAIELRPWLFTVARNRCRTLLRARYRGMAFSEPMEYEPSVEGLAVEVERREHLRDLMRDISRLPEDQRAALLLTQLETLRHDEVARVLDVPADKVKALVFQARSSLVASELARDTPCREIREQLATLSGAGLRRRTLRRHVRDCAGCREFELRLRRQRHAILVLLPVASSPIVRDAVAAQLAGGAASGAAAGGMAAGGGSAAGGGFSALVANAVAVKTATVLSVAAAGAGVVAVTSGVHLAGAVRDHSSGGQSPTLAAGIGSAAPPATVQPISFRPAEDRHRYELPGPSGRQGHVVRNNSVSPATAQAPSAAAPVTDRQTQGDTQSPPGQAKKETGGPDHQPPGEAKKQDPDSAAPGQGEEKTPDAPPPGQAKKPDSNSPPDGANKPTSSWVPPGQAKNPGAPPSQAPPSPQGQGNGSGGQGNGSAGQGNDSPGQGTGSGGQGNGPAGQGNGSAGQGNGNNGNGSGNGSPGHGHGGGGGGGGGANA